VILFACTLRSGPTRVLSQSSLLAENRQTYSDSFSPVWPASEIQVGFLPIVLDLPADHAPRHPLFLEHTNQGVRGFSPLAVRICAPFSGPVEGLCETFRKRMENGVAGPTVNRNLAMLRRMFKLAERESKVSNVPYFPMQKESEPREGFLERPKFEKLRAEMPELLRPTLTFCYETGCRTGAMAKVVWPWVNLADQEISLPPGVVKNRKPLIVPLADELTAMLKKKFRGHGAVFTTKNFRRAWIKACVKCGLGEKTGRARYQYRGLVPNDFRRSAVRNLVNSGVDTATAMKITGHRTLHIFIRYNIISTGQLHEAMEKVTSKKKAAK
jgi:integrase